jgi:tetratricopeptide (TPR) repeat protein
VTGNTNPPVPVFSRDGQIVLESEHRLTTYQVEPALEYRALVHVSSEPMSYERPSIRRDNRLLAIGSATGFVLWDLARGTECGFLPIGALQVMFEANGDLLTSGVAGVRRWPIQLDSNRSRFRIGPPLELGFSRTSAAGHISEDRLGRIIAMPRHTHVEVQVSGHLTVVGTLDECRYVAVSPDGEWLATGSHHVGAQVWRVRDARHVAEIPINTGTAVAFSPDGKWLLTTRSPCKLWSTETWAFGRELGGAGLCFSSDSRLVAIRDANRIIRLVEAETGRMIASLESPDSSDVEWATFSPDGSRLVLVPENNPAIHVWNLRAIRKRLAAMGLDWHAPAYSDDDSAAAPVARLPPLQVDHTGVNISPETLIQESTDRIKKDPNDAVEYHRRGIYLFGIQRYADAIDDFTIAARLRPDDGQIRYNRGAAYHSLERYEPAIADMEAALEREKPQLLYRQQLAVCCNKRALELADGAESTRDYKRALQLARRAIELTPSDPIYLNTLGVVEYRKGGFTESITTLEGSLEAGHGRADAFDLFFMAMAHHRLGHRATAGECYARAVRWAAANHGLSSDRMTKLAAIRVEADAVLAGRAGDLPDDVFARPR